MKLLRMTRFALVSTASLLFLPALVSLSADKDWLKFNAGLAKAAKEKKAVLIDFYTDWCHWCKVMDEKTFRNKAVEKKLRERFVTVRINAENANESVTYQKQTFNNPQLTRAFGVSGYPSLAFLTAKGEPITIVPGYVPPETFLQILDYVDTKCYESQVSFDDFVKNGGCEKKSKVKQE
jgi:thioredoxin-related protein